MIGVYSESSCFQKMFKSKLVTDQKLLEDVHEESLQIPKPNQPVPVQLSRRAFEGVQTPSSVLQITMKTSGHQNNTFRTQGQSLFNTKLDFRSRHWLGSLCKPSRWRGNTSGSCPVFQNILVFHSNAERSYSEDHPKARSSCPNVDLIKIELCYFWMDIVENHPDVANFRPEAR
jgi:hypothetical protein